MKQTKTMKRNVVVFLFLVIIGFVTTSCDDYLDEYGKYKLWNYSLFPGTGDEYNDGDFDLKWYGYTSGYSFELSGKNGEQIEILGVGRMRGVSKSKLRFEDFTEYSDPPKYSEICFIPKQDPEKIGWQKAWDGSVFFYLNDYYGAALRITNEKTNKVGYFVIYNEFSNRTDKLYFQRVKSLEEAINKW